LNTNTREKLIQQAEVLFSQKGFYGTSISDIAASLSISKQGLLHHFPSKEKLYAAVLREAADYLQQEIKEALDDRLPPREQLLATVNALASDKERTNRVVMLLMRELLDNRERAEAAQQWFLKPFLDKLECVVIAAQLQGEFLKVHPLAFVYQILGAVQYFSISQPTLKKLYSTQKFNDHRGHHIREIERMIEAAR
jgi:AcrR family transcriptional regulator